MSYLLEIILSVAVVALLSGLRYLLTPQHRRKESHWVRWWRLPGGNSHDPYDPGLRGEDEKGARMAWERGWRKRTTSAKPQQVAESTHRESGPAETVHRTPMYKGRPARLWWLPEQETPEGQRHAVRGTMQGPMVCPECAKPNLVDSAFCGECGAFLTTSDAPAPAASRS